LDGSPVHKKPHVIPWDPVSAEKGEYRHFMQKEIFEQARAVTDTLRGRVNFQTGAVHLEQLTLNAARRPSRIHAVACGTSLHAGLIGRFYIERIARLPVEADYGSEYRYRDPLIGPDMAILGITQSGETADTLAAMSAGQARGAQVWAIVNAVGSQAERLAGSVIHMRAGPEIGVCSTKTFLTSIVDQYLLACALAQSTGTAKDEQPYALARALAHLPGLVSRMLGATPIYQELANRFHDREHFLFLGRGVNYPIALEGALKLKEISYIHAEGYPAGEMKHGPIALIDEKMPVVCVAVRDSVYEKMISQIEQVKARGGTVIAIATEGDDFIHAKADYVIEVPPTDELLAPVLTAIPMQRLAYEMAVRLGCDVDQPRNLAKSVTVE
jgi:glucosamine--fructose-6-phosphate aminotransferase (isomerizing)